MKELPIRGRGVSENPPNRFESLEVVRDGWRDPEDPAPETRLLKDASRSIIAHNDSPDIPFDASLNPYRGCEHGCSYCLDADTPVLMADGTHRPIRDLETGDRIYGTVRRGWYRHYVRTEVQAHWKTERPSWRVTLEDGTELIASADHRFLTDRGWKFVTGAEQGRDRRPHLTTTDRLMGVGSMAAQPAGHGMRTRGYAADPVDPAIRRKRDIEGTALKSNAKLRVTAIEPLGETRPMYDITTGTGDFIADGVVSHNCYARPTHEYLGFSPGLDFETRIVVKENAPELLRETLADRGWEPKVLALSGVTDPYQPVERRLEVTRGCMEVLAEARHPVAVITKNHLVTRDIDLLSELAEHGAASVSVSITTLRNELQRVMEPRTAVPARRLAAIEKLAAAGIPVGVNVAPVIPGLTEEEIPDILAAAADAGATRAAYIMLRLPHGVSDLFERWLEQHFPDRREKVLNRVRDLRGGRLNDPRFGSRMKGSGPYAEQVRELFTIARRRHGLDRRSPPLSTRAFRHPRAGPQMELFPG